MTSQVMSQASYLRSHRSIKFTSQPQHYQPTVMGSTKLYGRDLKEYDEMDIESLLSKLTADELEELNNDIDPDNSLLPPAQRCRDQTNKKPTGPFRREKLKKFLEEKAKSEKDWDERVPFQPGIKRGHVFTPKDDDSLKNSTYGDMPIELDVDEEFADALKSAQEKDLVDLAGILEMHSIINQMQYYNALKGSPQDPELATFTGIVKPTLLKLIPDEPPNQTDVEDCIKRLNKNDPTLTIVNVNNMKHISRERIANLIEAAKNSKHLEVFSLANTAASDADLKGLPAMIERCTNLRNLNVESNFLTGEFLAQLMKATLKNPSLTEFRAENQRALVLGNKVEMDMTRSIEENDRLLRVGISFQCMEARHRVSEALERNYERLRLKRIGADI